MVLLRPCRRMSHEAAGLPEGAGKSRRAWRQASEHVHVQHDNSDIHAPIASAGKTEDPRSPMLDLGHGYGRPRRHYVTTRAVVTYLAMMLGRPRRGPAGAILPRHRLNKPSRKLASLNLSPLNHSGKCLLALPESSMATLTRGTLFPRFGGHHTRDACQARCLKQLGQDSKEGGKRHAHQARCTWRRHKPHAFKDGESRCREFGSATTRTGRVGSAVLSMLKPQWNQAFSHTEHGQRDNTDAVCTGAQRLAGNNLASCQQRLLATRLLATLSGCQLVGARAPTA